MSKKTNNRVSYRPKYPKGGQFNWNKFGKQAGQVAANYGRAVIDAPLTALGAGDVISDDQYKGNTANMFSGAANIIGGVGKAALPIAASAVGGPMAGMTVSTAQNQIGQYNPQAEGEDASNQQQMGQGLGQMANMGMQFYNMGQGQPQSGIGMMANGGINMIPNSEVELNENSIAPDGEFTQFSGPPHSRGGIPTNLEQGEIIFSDRLRPKGVKETYAQLNKPNNTNKEDKVLEGPNSTQESKKTAELMKKVKSANSAKLFQDQEQAKQNRLARYMQKHGMKFPDGGIKSDNTFKNPMLFNQAYAAQGYQNVPGVKGRMYNPANYNYVEYAPIPKYSDKPFIQPNPNRQPMQFTGAQSGAFNPNVGNYIGPNGLPIQTQSISFSKGGVNPPWYKGIGDALNGEINAGRMYMENPNTSKVGELNPLNTPYEEPVDWRQAVIDSQDNPNVLRDYMQTPNSGKQIGQLETNKQVDFNPYTKGASRNSLNPTYNQPNNRSTNWQDPAYYAAGTLAQSAGPLAYLKEQGKKYDTQKFYDYNPERLDPSSSLRDADIQAKEGAYSLANASGGNSGSYLSNRIALAGQNTLNKAGIRSNYENMNAQIGNQGQQFNIGNRYRTDDINAANKGQALTNYYQSLGQVGTNVASGMRDYRADQMDQERMSYLPYMYNSPEFQNLPQVNKYRRYSRPGFKS